MKLVINDKRRIRVIQEEFNEVFPYLKLEFFSKSHIQGGSPSHKLIKSEHTTLADCRTIHEEGQITILPSMTVSDLEQRFGDVYGLGIQILRKSGNVWLKTSVTDSWTLEEQNRQGEILSKVIL